MNVAYRLNCEWHARETYNFFPLLIIIATISKGLFLGHKSVSLEHLNFQMNIYMFFLFSSVLWHRKSFFGQRTTSLTSCVRKAFHTKFKKYFFLFFFSRKIWKKTWTNDKLTYGKLFWNTNLCFRFTLNKNNPQFVRHI